VLHPNERAIFVVIGHRLKGCWGSPVNEENAQYRDGIALHAWKSLVGRPTQLRLRGGEDQEEGNSTARTLVSPIACVCL